MDSVRAEEQSVAGLRGNSDGILPSEAPESVCRPAEPVVTAVAEIDSPPLRTARDEEDRTTVGRHLVEHDHRLYEASAAVDVGPGSIALVAMPNVLMPVEHDTIARALEMGLAQQMIHRVTVQQLRAGHGQARIAADLEQIGLTAAGPDDTSDDLGTVLFPEHEVRAAMQPGPGQRARDRFESVEAQPHSRNLVGAEQAS